MQPCLFPSSNEDQAEFDMAIERLKVRMPSYFDVGGKESVPPIDGDGGDVQSFWQNPTKWVDALTQETCRDNGHHAQFALGSAIHAAEVAFNQGIDVYTTYQERLTDAMELMAKQFNSGNMQGTCGNDTPTADRLSTWEIGYSHYYFYSKVPLPGTKKLITSSIRKSSTPSVLNLAWEGFSHASIDLGNSTSPPTPSPAPAPGPGPAPSGCPGGSLSACIGLCPSSPAVAYKACVDACVTRCS
jgi:hypothetical protein